MREPLDSRDRWIRTMTELTTPKERKPHAEVRVGDVADFKPGEITCFCGASSKAGYFHMSDSNGWPVNPGDVAETRRKGRKPKKGALLWDGVSVVCSACSTIYEGTTGTVTGFGAPPEFTKEPKRKTRRSEEAQRQHRPEGLLTKVKRLFGAARPVDPREDLAAELDWQSKANAAVEAWKGKKS